MINCWIIFLSIVLLDGKNTNSAIFKYIYIYLFQFSRDLTSKMKDKAICHLVIIMLLTNVNVIELNWLTPFIPQNSHKR